MTQSNDARARQLNQIQEEWTKINIWLTEITTTASCFHLGAVFREYVLETMHTSWDGFSSRDITAIRRFLIDLELYHRNRTT